MIHYQATLVRLIDFANNFSKVLSRLNHNSSSGNNALITLPVNFNQEKFQYSFNYFKFLNDTCVPFPNNFNIERLFAIVRDYYYDPTVVENHVIHNWENSDDYFK